MQSKKILILIAGICGAFVLAVFVYSQLRNPRPSGTAPGSQNAAGQQNANVSTQTNYDPTLSNSSTQTPFPSFSPNINYIKNNTGDSLSVEQKKNMLTFAGNIVDLALTYQNNEFSNGPALARYASAKGIASLDQLQRQYATAQRSSQYAVVDSSKPIGLFSSSERTGAYIFSFEVSLFDVSGGQQPSPAGRAQVEIQIFRASTGYEFDHIYVSPL